ncbi:MAG TPA: zinc metallopeptidase [Pirellulaceae bacterium]|nr:zinc metallopeptidase [Pirellulaceae bacterium]
MIDPIYFVFIAPGILLSLYASYLVKSRFQHYSRVPSARGITGARAAQMLLNRAGISDVQIVRVEGFLTDHYDPANKRLALSPPVYDSHSVAALGVATHEAGHAIQHATGYYPLAWRSALVPVVQFGSPISMYALMIGLGLMAAGSALGKIIFFVGIFLFVGMLLFQLVTLPVEFNASARAKALVVEAGIISPAEREGVDKVLNAAALTYVAAFVQTLLTLLYFLWRSGLLSGRRD